MTRSAFSTRAGASRLAWALVLSAVCATPTLADEHEHRRTFGQNLCQKALAGRFPKLELDDVIAASHDGGEDPCACVADRYAHAGPRAHHAVMADMQSGLLRHAAFDEHVASALRSCLAENAGADLGEAFVGHVLQCEGALMEDGDLAGLDLKAFKARMARSGLDAETMCGCSGDYYLQHHQQITTDVLADGEGDNSHDRHMVQSLQQCLDLGGRWPEHPSDPAFDPDMDAEGLCHAVLMRTIEPRDFDRVAQSRWEKGSGIGADDLCGCVAPRSLDRISDADGPDDVDLLQVVLDEIAGCRQNMWAP